jgi:hypothetical protein
MQKAERPKSGSESLLQAALLLAAVIALATVPPSFVERLPSVCLNRHIFGFCPACGSLRALIRLFHGDVAGAVRFNANVLVTAPLLVLLLLGRLRRGLRPGRPVRSGRPA